MLTEIRLPLAELKTSAVSSMVVCAPGTLLTGASFTALTVTATVSVSVFAPPEPLFPWSSVVIVRVEEPLKSAVGR